MNPRLFHNGKVQLYAGDCTEVLRELPDNSIDAVVTDPPYHLTSITKRFSKNGYSKSNLEQPADKNLDGIMAGSFRRLAKGFMGKQWDGGDIAFRPELWAEVLRVLKPGGHMVCFGGTRTYHRMVYAIEDAGFEIRDAIMWHYGSGFPKSHDVSKGIDRAAGVEREVVGIREYAGGHVQRSSPDKLAPPIGTFVRTQDDRLVTAPATDAARQWRGYGTALKPSTEIICLARKPLSESTVAENVLRWGTGALNIDGCRIGTAVETWPTSRSYAPGQMQPGGKGQTVSTGDAPNGRWPANLCHDGSPEVLAGFPETNGVVGTGNDKHGGFGYHGGAKGAYREGLPDSGSAARFFYTAKADKDDRLNSKHPTVKPVDLMQWLVRLVTPPCVISWECPQCRNENLSGMQEQVPAETQGPVPVLDSPPTTGSGEAPQASDKTLPNMRCADELDEGDQKVLLDPVPSRGDQNTSDPLPGVQHNVCAQGEPEVLLMAVRPEVEKKTNGPMRRVRDCVSASSSTDEVLQPQVCAEKPHETTCDDSSGLHRHMDARASDGSVIGLPHGTSLSNGDTSESKVGVVGGGSSHQRHQDGQPDRESSIDGAQPAQSASQRKAKDDRVSALQGSDGSRKCPSCGSPLTKISHRGVVLDPFAGTGTTGAAAFIEGRRCVLIEREAEYLADIEKRMEMLLSGPDERARKLAKPEPYESLPLFGAA